MKLSNKILVGFFGLAFIYLTAVFAEVRLRGTRNVIDESNSIAETVDLSGIAYVVLDNVGHDVSVVGSREPQLEVRSLSGDMLRSLTYAISGDTLTLSAANTADLQSARISVYVAESGLKGIAIRRTLAVVRGLDVERLRISQDAGKVWMSENTIGTIELDATGKSYLELAAMRLDTLSVAIERSSQVMVMTPLTLVKASLNDSAMLHVREADEIQVKKDKSSKLHSY